MDPKYWDPLFVDWHKLTPETNEDHAMFLAKYYLDGGILSEDGRWTAEVREELLRFFLGIIWSMRREEHLSKIKEMDVKGIRG